MSEKRRLTDHEGTLLSLVLRAQPVTAYQIARIYELSPVSNFNTSKGKIYPIIHRLRELGLVRTRLVKGDARGTEQLTCTKAGEKAIKGWVLETRPTHLLLDDPLRTKVQSFGLLTPDERVRWIVEVKAQLIKKLEEVEDYGRRVAVPFQDFAHDNSIRSLRSRMDWLDMMLHRTLNDDRRRT